MAISKPLLPPKSGYTEVIDESGNHVYKPTPETLAAQQKKNDLATYAELAAAIKEGVNLVD